MKTGLDINEFVTLGRWWVLGVTIVACGPCLACRPQLSLSGRDGEADGSESGDLDEESSGSALMETESAGGGGDDEPTTGGTPACGNGSLDLGEECDGLELGSASCEEVFDGLDVRGGDLSCTPGCQFDTSECKVSARTATMFISEYREGEPGNGALEIFNPSPHVIADLGDDECRLEFYDAAQELPVLVQYLYLEIASLQTLVMCEFWADVANECDLFVDQLAHEGVVAFALSCRDEAGDYFFVDSAGQILGDETAELSNVILRRRDDIVTGDEDPWGPFEWSVEWDAYDAPDFGNHPSGG